MFSLSGVGPPVYTVQKCTYFGFERKDFGFERYMWDLKNRFRIEKWMLDFGFFFQKLP